MQQPTRTPSAAYANYVLALLSLVYVMNFIDRQILAMLIEPIKQEFGVSDTALGLLSGFAFAFLYTLAGIPIARWADRGSRTRIITLALTTRTSGRRNSRWPPPAACLATSSNWLCCGYWSASARPVATRRRIR